MNTIRCEHIFNCYALSSPPINNELIYFNCEKRKKANIRKGMGRRNNDIINQMLIGYFNGRERNEGNLFWKFIFKPK